MAKKKVIAYFMHEQEQAAAWEKMENVDSTESYLLGEIEEEDLSYLETEGLIIQVLEVEISEEVIPDESVTLTRLTHVAVTCPHYLYHSLC